MVLLSKILQLALIAWIIRLVIGRWMHARMPASGGDAKAKRFDTSGKNVVDGEYRDVRTPHHDR